MLIKKKKKDHIVANYFTVGVENYDSVGHTPTLLLLLFIDKLTLANKKNKIKKEKLIVLRIIEEMLKIIR